MQIIIFSVPERNLGELLMDCEGYPVKIIDDPATYGKTNFWKRWKEAVDYCKSTNDDYFLFLPDDVKYIDWEFLNQWMIRYYGKPFVLNLISDKRQNCWGKVFEKTPDLELQGYKLVNQGFFDCGGLIPRCVLDQIDIDEVPSKWFDRPDKSSGVGFQLTMKFRRLGVRMYRPFPSLAKHGNHPSIMHPEERLRNPLESL